MGLVVVGPGDMDGGGFMGSYGCWANSSVAFDRAGVLRSDMMD